MFKEIQETTATFDTVKVQMIHTEATSAAKAAVAARHVGRVDCQHRRQ